MTWKGDKRVPKDPLVKVAWQQRTARGSRCPWEAVATAMHTVALLRLSLGRAASGERTGLLTFPLYGHIVTKQLQRAVKLCSRWKKSPGAFLLAGHLLRMKLEA